MDLLMNGLLMAATLFAGGYCWVLARRVRDLKSLDSGLGGAIVTLTRQVELARTTLEEARTASRDTRQDLAQLVSKAEGAAGQLRMLIAAAPLPTAAAASHAPQLVPTPAPAASAPQAEPASGSLGATPALQPVAAAPAAEPPAAQPEPAQVIAIRPLPQIEPAPAPHTPAPHLTEVPKPRALAPIENPLRRKEPAELAPVPSEDDIIEALSALAGGR